jgi:thioredoxin-like negative regulator of GroEL
MSKKAAEKLDSPPRSCPAQLRFYSDRAVESPGLHILMLHSSDCPHCHETMPQVRRLAQATCGRASVHTVEVNHFPDVAERFHVEQLPTIVALEAGREVYRVEGSITAEELWRDLQPYLR